MGESFISIICSSNRPYLWREAYNSISSDAKKIKFELIFIGPEDPDFILPENMVHIKTGNIKVPQCFEVGMRKASGNLFIYIADDFIYNNGAIGRLYRRYLEICTRMGNNKVVVMPKFRCGGTVSNLKYNKLRHPDAPFASLNSALVDRELISQIGGIDKRFIGVYWDCDLAMRLNTIGVHFEKYSEIDLVEPAHHKGIKYRLHRICKPYDKTTLNTFWTRLTKEGEVVPSNETYCYMGDKRWVLTKNRQKEVQEFSDEDILHKSQGVKEFEGLKWD